MFSSFFLNSSDNLDLFAVMLTTNAICLKFAREKAANAQQMFTRRMEAHVASAPVEWKKRLVKVLNEFTLGFLLKLKLHLTFTGYCFNGICPTLNAQCEKIWGYGGSAADKQCYEQFNSKGSMNGHCGMDQTGHYLKCDPE